MGVMCHPAPPHGPHKPGEIFDATIKPPDPKAPRTLRFDLISTNPADARLRTPQAPRGRAPRPERPRRSLQALVHTDAAEPQAQGPYGKWGWGLKFRGSQIVLEHIMTSKPKSRGPGKAELTSELQPSQWQERPGFPQLTC